MAESCRTWPQDLGDLVEVGGEEQEGGESGGADRVALGQGLGRVADRVEGVGDVADALGRAGHLGDAARVVGDRAEGVHREDVGGGHQHAHRGDGGAEDAADVGLHRAAPAARFVLNSLANCVPQKAEAMSARLIAMAVLAVVSKPTAMPEMMLVAGPVRDSVAISCTGRQAPAV